MNSSDNWCSTPIPWASSRRKVYLLQEDGNGPERIAFSTSGTITRVYASAYDQGTLSPVQENEDRNSFG